MMFEPAHVSASVPFGLRPSGLLAWVVHAVQRLTNPPNPPQGCAFNPRCPLANDRCRQELTALHTTGGIKVACHAVEEAIC